MTDATAWDQTKPVAWLPIPHELLVDVGLVPGPERPPRRRWFTRRQRIAAVIICAAAPFVGWGIGWATETEPPTELAAAIATTSTTSEHNPETVAPAPTASSVSGTSTTSEAGEEVASAPAPADQPEPEAPTSTPTTVAEPVEVIVPPTMPPELPAPVVDWACVGDATWGQGPTYNLAMWQAYGGTGLPEEHPELWPEVAHSLYTNEGIDIPQDCVT